MYSAWRDRGWAAATEKKMKCLAGFSALSLLLLLLLRRMARGLALSILRQQLSQIINAVYQHSFEKLSQTTRLILDQHIWQPPWQRQAHRA